MIEATVSELSGLLSERLLPATHGVRLNQLAPDRFLLRHEIHPAANLNRANFVLRI